MRKNLRERAMSLGGIFAILGEPLTTKKKIIALVVMDVSSILDTLPLLVYVVGGNLVEKCLFSEGF